MLDLRTYITIYELQMLDGEVIEIPNATQGLYEKILGYDGLKEEHMVDALYELFHSIISTNISGREYTLDYCKRLPLEAVCAVIADYLGFNEELLGE